MKKVYKCDRCKCLVDEDSIRQFGNKENIFNQMTMKQICTNCIKKQNEEL